MKRNMKFLLLLAIFTSSIMAAYFISGCGDDSTVIEIPPPLSNDTTTIVEEEDRVLGSIQGVVSSAYDNSLLQGVTVKYVKNDEEYTTTTDADGYYLIDDSLSSGYYTLTFSVNGYAVYTATVYIPTIAQIKGDIDDDPVGATEYMATADISLYPLSATVRGVVYTALPAPENKDQHDQMSLDDPNLVSRAAGVTVLLEYEYDIHPHVYTTTTDASGEYEFTNVPLFVGDFAYESSAKGVDGPDKSLAFGDVTITTLPFSGGGDSTYEGTSQTIEMVPPPEATVVPSIFAPLFGNNNPVFTDKPVVLTYNFERPGFIVTDDLQLVFSRPMDTLSASFNLEWYDNPYWEDVPFDYTWSGSDAILTVNPALDLLAGPEQYRFTFSGNGTDGLSLYGGTWQRSLYTQQGIRFVSTNLDDYGDADNPFKDFPLDANITITFSMDVDLTNDNGWVTLIDASNNREVNATISASGATVTVNPTDSLKSDNTYELDFRIYSNLRGDYIDDYEIRGATLYFTSVNTETKPGTPANFAIYEGSNWKADFNTTMINFKWDAVANADYYEIYASDNMNNTDVIVVTGDIDHVDYLTSQQGSVDFTDPANAVFDLYADDTLDNGDPLITPFSGGTVISFQVRAVNSWGPGDFSTPISVADETPPDFTVVQGDPADNTAGATALEVGVDVNGDLGSFNEMEYVSSIAFSFVEAGGDPAFVLGPGDVSWTWDLDMRDGAGVITVPAGKCASMDQMIVSITDNSGNTGYDTISLHPYLVFTDPVDTTTSFEAPTPVVAWSITDMFNTFSGGSGTLDLFWSDDGGATWLDSTIGWKNWDDSNTTWVAFDTVYSNNFMLGLRDNDGGWIWRSDVFPYTGIDVTGPDSAYLDTGTFYDEGGVDSSGIPLTWAYAGLDSVAIWWYNDWDDEWYKDTVVPVSGGTGSLTWYPPNIGRDYVGNLRVADWDVDSRPRDDVAWTFNVINDYTTITAPTTGQAVPGGADFDITWDTTVYTPHLTGGKVRIEYSIDRGATWMVLDDSTANDGLFTWAVPGNTYANDSAMVRIRDKWNLNTLDTTGYFDISGIVVDSPAVGTEWLVGTGQNIRWHSVGNVGLIDIYWSRDGFTTDSSLVVNDHAGGSPYAWTVPANSACSTVTFRIYGNTDNVYGESQQMTFSGVVVTAPNSGNLAQGTGTSITWVTIGTLVGSTVDIQYKYVTSGPPPATSGWLDLASGTANDGDWTWDPIPAPPAEQAWVRVKRAGAPTGSYQSGEFSISGVVVKVPNGGESWAIGSSNDIEWNVINPTDVGNITIDLYKDPGAAHVATLATGVVGADTIWNWTVPQLAASDFYYIQISSDLEPAIKDVSDAYFSIPLNITVTAPNGGETLTLGVGNTYNITWTDNGVADPVTIEYTTDNGTTWNPVVGAGAVAPGTNTYSWDLDPATDANLTASANCMVRITTNSGPAAADTSDAVFTIN